jgi:hypothetical protein
VLITIENANKTRDVCSLAVAGLLSDLLEMPLSGFLHCFILFSSMQETDLLGIGLALVSAAHSML